MMHPVQPTVAGGWCEARHINKGMNYIVLRAQEIAGGRVPKPQILTGI